MIGTKYIERKELWVIIIIIIISELLFFFKFGHDFVIIYIVVFGFQCIQLSSFKLSSESLLWYVLKLFGISFLTFVPTGENACAENTYP